MYKPKFIAHRGLSGHFPENTHIAFNAAWATDFDGIELDIQVTKDQKVVVFHDPNTQRTTGESLSIKDSYWEQLQHLDVGKGGKGGSDRFCEHIPLLTDVLERMPSDKLVQIEIKQQIDDLAAVIKTLSDTRSDITIQIISFSPEKLIEVKNALPHYDYFLIIDGESDLANPIAFVQDNQLTGLDLQHSLIDDSFSTQMTDAQLPIGSWTVNDIDTAQQLINRGVEFITGDYAELLTLKNL